MQISNESWLKLFLIKTEFLLYFFLGPPLYFYFILQTLITHKLGYNSAGLSLCCQQFQEAICWLFQLSGQIFNFFREQLQAFANSRQILQAESAAVKNQWQTLTGPVFSLKQLQTFRQLYVPKNTVIRCKKVRNTKDKLWKFLVCVFLSTVAGLRQLPGKFSKLKYCNPASMKNQWPYFDKSPFLIYSRTKK